MPTVHVKLCTPAPTGPSAPGTTEIRRLTRRHRALVGSGAIVLGVLAGAVSVLTPGMHLVFVWLGPLLGVGLGLSANRLTAWATHTEGTCPACSEALSLPGPGPVWDSAPSMRCPECGATLLIAIPRYAFGDREPGPTTKERAWP